MSFIAEQEVSKKWKAAYIDAIADIAELHAEIARMHSALAAAYADSETAPPSKKRKRSDDAAAAASAPVAAPGGYRFGDLPVPGRRD
jgi:hypothetical protein